MLNVLTRSGVYLLLKTNNGIVPSILIGPASDIIEGTGPIRPGLDLGQFDQGPSGDDAGNTSVYHLKVDGDICALPPGITEQQYVNLQTAGLQEAYTGRLSGRDVDFSGIMSANGGSWSQVTQNVDRSMTGDYWWRIHQNYICKDAIEIKRLKAGVLQFDYRSDASWDTYDEVGKRSSYSIHDVATFNVSRRYDGTFSYIVDSVRYISEYSGRTGERRDYSYSFASELREQYRIGLPELSNYGLAFNSRTWTSLMQDVSMSETKDQTWPSLCQDAVLSMNYLDCNTLALIKDITSLRSTVEDSVQSLKDLQNLPNSSLLEGAKLVSNADLSRRYGLNLTIQDAYSVGEALSRLRENLKADLKHCQKIRSALTTVVSGSVGPSLQVDYHYLGRLSLNDPAIQELMQSLYEWDLYPSLGNAWDFVPYSFVVDWFVDVGGLLEDVDTNLQMYQYHLLSAVKSRKVKCSGSPTKLILSDVPLCGNVRVSEYHRWIDQQFDPMPLSLECDPSKWIGHLVEGAELFIQRL